MAAIIFASACHMRLIVGVSMLTIYHRENGEAKPRPKALVAWARVRGIGKREALRRLELLEG